MEAESMNPIARLLSERKALVLDGGLATHLETLGGRLDDALWSAKLLADDPELIVEAHLDFLRSGADCIIGASYQGSLPGFTAAGLSRARGVDLLRDSVTLARQARARFAQQKHATRGGPEPIVAASVGPYGAYLADGSEYSGRYLIDANQLADFHAERWSILADAGADLLVCETIPSSIEAEVLLELSNRSPEVPVWMSFSCRDADSLWDETPYAEMVTACDHARGVVAVGVNCTAPEFVSALIGTAKPRTDKPILVCPNSGEPYDAKTKSWVTGRRPSDWGARAAEWVAQGAQGVGGCCRVGPREISQISAALHDVEVRWVGQGAP